MAKKKNSRIKSSKSIQSDGKEKEKQKVDVDVDDSAELTASHPSPPPPPPPPPAPPLPTSPTFKASPRVVRRQSTSAASPLASARVDSAHTSHARSATDPSSSTPNLALFSNQSTSKASTPLPTLIAQAALKRSNTINSFAPRRSLSPSSSPTRWGGDGGDDGVRTNGNNSARRTSSPPPAIKPKPASLTLSNTTAQKKMVAHERSASALLRAALVQGAAAAAAVQSGGSNFNPNSSSNAGGSGSKSGLATTGNGSGSGTGNGSPNGKKPSIDRPEPERRGSVAQLARSLESTLQFSAPPSPGTPPALFKRSSVASNMSLMSLKSVRSVRNGNANANGDGGDLAERDEGAEEGDEEAERDEREEGRERTSLPPPANFKAVVASLVAKGIKAYASPSAPTDSRPAKKSTVAVSTAPAPSPPPTPPLSPPSTGRTETDMFTAPESPPFSPPTPPTPSHRASSTSPPPPPRPSKASKPKFVVQRREAGEKLQEEEGVVEAVPSSPAREEEDSASAAAAAALGENDDDDIDEAEKAQLPASASAPDPVSVPASTSTKRLSVPPSRPPPPPLPPPEEESEAGAGAGAGDEAGEEASENKNGEEIPPTLNPKDAESSEGATTPNEQEAHTPALKYTPASPSPPLKSAKRYSIPPPPRPPPPPPVEVDEEIAEEAEEGGEGEGEGEETPVKPSKPQRPVPELPPPTPVDGPGPAQREAEAEADTEDGDEEDSDGALLGGIVVQEPDELELAGIVDEHGQVQLRLEGGEREYDSAQDSSDDERYESYKSALSRNGSTSLPPTPPTKHDVSFPINHLTSKWSRNTSAVQSANASASTLALVDQSQLHTHAEVEGYTDAEEDEEGDTTLAHANVHELTESISPDDIAKDINNDINNNINKEAKTITMPEEEGPMDSRFKFPPVESFPPPPPLFKRNATNDKNPSNRKGMAFANESETSLASVGGEREENESADDADRESTAPRNRKKSKTKIALRTAVLAALGKSTAPSGAVAEPIPEQDSSPTASHAEGETETTTHHSSDDESNPITWQMKARFAKLDVNEPSSNSNRPAPFPTSGDGEHGQSQSAPEVPRVSRRPGAGVKGSPEDEVKKRQVRLSSKLLPITGPTRMNTSPSTTTITAWGKHKMVMSSETVGTIGTIATEPGDLEQSQSQYGGNSASGGSRAQSPPPPLPPSSFFLHRMKSDASHRRPPVRRQTTSISQASRFVEDLPFFNKRSTSPTSMSRSPSQYQDQSPVHQRATTVSFSSRVRTGSMGTIMGMGTGTGPATRKNSLIPELRAATIEAAERPLSAVSGDFVLVEEPEEFDIPRAEWDLPRIPSGSLRFPSTMDLRTKMAQAQAAAAAAASANGNANGNREKLGPSSAYATTVPVSIAPVMQHSRSATTGTSGTSATSATSSTAKSSASAPAAPIGATNTLTPANAITFQVSSGSDMTGVGTGSRIGAGDSRGGRLSSDALLDLWGRVGVYMSDAAALLHDKSRRMLVGDGTYPGFALAVARQVPTACIPSKSARYPYGHLIYFQTAGTVHKRYAEVLPGDVIVLQNALFKGVRGPLHQSYQEELGTKGDPVVGVIGEFEARKSKVRVYQANQHVGIQTVEYVSYRFEDLKSGTIKIFRVPDS